MVTGDTVLPPSVATSLRKEISMTTTWGPLRQRLARGLFASSPIICSAWYCCYLEPRYYRPISEPITAAEILGHRVKPIEDPADPSRGRVSPVTIGYRFAE